MLKAHLVEITLDNLILTDARRFFQQYSNTLLPIVKHNISHRFSINSCMIDVILNKLKRRDHEYMVYRLTRPYYSVKHYIEQLFKGRSYDLKGDSRTPWSNMLDNNDSLHYSERHGLHLNPTKKRREKR